MKASHSQDFFRKFDPCNVKDIEFVKPRYNILDNLRSTCPKKEPCHILLALDDGLYLVSQKENINATVNWKLISRTDRTLYREVMKCIHSETCMSYIGIGISETAVPSEIREKCRERFKSNMCNIRVCAKPAVSTFGNQTKAHTVNDVASSIHALKNVTSCSSTTGDQASGDITTITMTEPGPNTPFPNGSLEDEMQIWNTQVSIEIKGKTSNSNSNTVSLKMQSEAFIDFSINDDFFTILHILKKEMKRSENTPLTEEQSENGTATNVPVDGFNHSSKKEYHKPLGAIPKSLKYNKKPEISTDNFDVYKSCIS